MSGVLELVVRDPGIEWLTYTVAEASSATGLSQRTIRRLIKSGRLRVVRVGSRVLIPTDSLRRFLSADPGERDVTVPIPPAPHS